VSPRDKILSTLRTGVAAGIGALATWLATHLGVVLDDDSSTTLIAAAMVIATTTYHATASWIQRQWPKVAVRWPALNTAAGWLVTLLLGAGGPPTYNTADTPVANESTAP
jgi:hypothetical protein